MQLTNKKGVVITLQGREAGLEFAANRKSGNPELRCSNFTRIDHPFPRICQIIDRPGRSDPQSIAAPSRLSGMSALSLETVAKSKVASVRRTCQWRKMHVQSMQRANRDGAYERPSDAFLSGSMSDCAEKGFVRNAMHREASAALRTAGLWFPVM